VGGSFLAEMRRSGDWSLSYVEQKPTWGGGSLRQVTSREHMNALNLDLLKKTDVTEREKTRGGAFIWENG